MIQHRSPISGIAAWRDEFVATAGYDNQVILWDRKTKTPIARAWHDHLANQCSFSPDGRFLVTASSDYGARLWSVPDLQLHAVFSAQEDDVEMAVFHPTRPLVATASRDHRVRVYEFDGTLLTTFEGHTADVISVEWSRDGRTLISSSDDGTIKRWSLDGQRMIEDIDMAGVETDTVVLCGDGTIFAGDDEGKVTVIAGRDRKVISAHDAGIKRLVFDEVRGMLVSLSYDRTMRLWRFADGTLELLNVTDLPAIVWPRSCAFGTGSTLLFGTFGASYLSYDYDTRQWEDVRIEDTPGVNAVQPFGGGTLTVGDAGVVRRDDKVQARLGSLCNFLTVGNGLVFTGGQLGILFDALTGRRLYQHRSPLNCAAAFERDGVPHAVVGTYTGEGLVFRMSEPGRAEFVSELRLHANAVKGIAASGDLIFSVCADTSAAWTRISTLEQVATVKGAHDRISNGCASLGEGCFASIGRDLKLRIWSPERHATVVDTQGTHSIKCVGASEDGRYVATGSYYGEVAIYDRDNEKWAVQDRPTASGISSIAYDPDAKAFIASSYDGHVYRSEP
jgi:toxoflavin biosynthesis protein ToxC